MTTWKCCPCDGVRRNRRFSSRVRGMSPPRIAAEQLRPLSMNFGQTVSPEPNRVLAAMSPGGSAPPAGCGRRLRSWRRGWRWDWWPGWQGANCAHCVRQLWCQCGKRWTAELSCRRGLIGTEACRSCPGPCAQEEIRGRAVLVTICHQATGVLGCTHLGRFCRLGWWVCAGLLRQCLHGPLDFSCGRHECRSTARARDFEFLHSRRHRQHSGYTMAPGCSCSRPSVFGR
jgi:hypothetical protein